ncbi:MAG: polysaccharide biosynthesis protein [Anaerocolumna sp.]|nr:polysaccharide biosynthesis protein [Anaerocolumna sp.]
MANNNTQFKKAGSFYLIGNLFNKGISFLTVPIFTRILSTTDYGIVTTYGSWVVILTMVIGCAMHMGVRAAFIDYKNEIDDILTTITSFTLVSGAVYCFFIGLIALMINKSISVIIVLCVLQGLSCALIENFSMYLMMQYKYKFRTFLMIAPNLISAIISILTILFITKNKLYLGRIVPTAFIMIGFAFLLIVIIYKKGTPLFSRKYIKYILSISAPLVLHGIALNILSQSDRTMITWLADSSQTGIYSLIYNFSMIATVITTSLEGIWIPWFYERLKNREINTINFIAKDFISLMTICMVCVIFAGPEVVKIMSSNKYWEGIVIIPPVILSNYVIFAYTLYVNIEHFYKKTASITINTMTAACSNIILNLIFIPKYGYIAAAYTTLASYTLSFVLHAKKAKKLDANVYPIISFIVPFICVICASVIFYIFLSKWYLRWTILIFYVVLMLINKKNRILFYFPSVKEKLHLK